jgi:hypothetical protein
MWIAKLFLYTRSSAVSPCMQACFTEVDKNVFPYETVSVCIQPEVDAVQFYFYTYMSRFHGMNICYRWIIYIHVILFFLVCYCKFQHIIINFFVQNWKLPVVLHISYANQISKLVCDYAIVTHCSLTDYT